MWMAWATPRGFALGFPLRRALLRSFGVLELRQLLIHRLGGCVAFGLRFRRENGGAKMAYHPSGASASEARAVAAASEPNVD